MRVSTISRCLLWAALAVTMALPVAAVEVGDFSQPLAPAESGGVGHPSRYDRQPMAEPRPFEQQGSQPLPTTYPAPQTELVNPTAAADAASTATQSPPARLAEQGGSLPLAPPEEAASGSTRNRELPALATAGASLGIVLGLFLLVVWVVRRGGPRESSWLPADAVEVLGRAPLIGRQQVHLVRCGHKLLLVCAMPNSITTLTEITDPAEVERLLEACQAGGGAGSPFRQMIDQFDNPPRDRRYSARHEPGDIDFTHLEAMHNSAAEPVA